jgi:hypothetical protein
MLLSLPQVLNVQQARGTLEDCGTSTRVAVLSRFQNFTVSDTNAPISPRNTHRNSIKPKPSGQPTNVQQPAAAGAAPATPPTPASTASHAGSSSMSAAEEGSQCTGTRTPPTPHKRPVAAGAADASDPRVKDMHNFLPFMRVVSVRFYMSVLQLTRLVFDLPENPDPSQPNMHRCVPLNTG